jgi:hypothetical protein
MAFDEDGVKIMHILTTTSSQERYTSNNNTSLMFTKRLPSIPLELMILKKENKKDKMSVEIAVGNMYTSKITGSVRIELFEKTDNKILEKKEQIASIDAKQFNYQTLEFTKNAPYTGKYYLKINVDKTNDPLPEGVNKLCNELTVDLPTYISNGSDGDSNNSQNGDTNTGLSGGPVIIPDDKTPQKSNNAKLSILNIDKGTLSPAFDKNTGLYDLSLDTDIKGITLNLSTEDNKASLIIDGVVKSNSVTNYHINTPVEKSRLEISVKAENGEVKTYIINIKRNVVKDDGKKPSTDANQFTDVNNHWAKGYILKLVNLGMMTGYPDKTFKPDNKITRAEAAVVLVKIFNKTPDNINKLAFKDGAKIPSWAYGYIKTAVQMGWIKGYTDDTFKAANYITRQEFTAMFVRAMGYNKLNIDKTTFADDAKIASWAKGDIGKAAELNLIGGYQDKTFRPLGNITRAEVCVIAQKYIEN